MQYQLLEPEAMGFFYTGTYLGTKKVLAVGAAFDAQSAYHGYDADVFFDYPSGPGAITAQADYNRFDGGDFLRTLPKQNDVLLEVGYFLRELQLTPVLQLSTRRLVDTTTGDETRWSIGANYWWAGHNSRFSCSSFISDPRTSM